MADEALAKTLEQETAVNAAMQNGDPTPRINSWASSDDITLFGAWQPIAKGHEAVTDTMRWVASRFSGADAVSTEHIVVASSGDLAYAVGFERSQVSVEGAPPHEQVIRVTHIYRRIDGEWKLVHRHADFSPPDRRSPDKGLSSPSRGGPEPE
jgi:ketosteroid isomerase-like protein